MITIKDIIKLPVTKNEVIEALTKSLEQNFIDNLRNRPKTVQLDCKIRGYLGEIALTKWFKVNDIDFVESNYIPDGADMDIDLSYNANGIIYSLEIKTSLIPDFYKNISRTLNTCDIKLIKRTFKIDDLKGDIHIQIYFDFLRAARDSFLSSLNPDWEDYNDIYNKLKLSSYIDNTYFVAWIDKPTLVNNVNNKPDNNKVWSFPNSQKNFWSCKLSEDSKAPIDIIKYIKTLNNMKPKLISFISDRYVVGLTGFIYTVLDENNGHLIFVNSASSENYMLNDMVQQGQYYYYHYCGISRPEIEYLGSDDPRVLAAMLRGGNTDMTSFRRFTDNIIYNGNYPE